MDACGALPRATAFAAGCSFLQEKRACSGVRRWEAPENWSWILVATERSGTCNESIRSSHHYVRAARRGPRSDLERAGIAVNGIGRSADAICCLRANCANQPARTRRRSLVLAHRRIGADRAATGRRE